MKRKSIFFASPVVLALGIAATVWWPSLHGLLGFTLSKVRGGYSVADRLAQYGAPVEERLRAPFRKAGLPYPPAELAYVAFKDARRLEVYGRMSTQEPWRFVKEYAVLAASGNPGPKLREGDYQVPEGVYRVELLNPNSRFHLSIRLNYPNDFDRKMAAADGRSQLGGDIMIHGNSVSVGCLAMGDEAAEELFVLAALATGGQVKVVISPTDFRLGARAVPVEERGWSGILYGALRQELRQFSRPRPELL